MRNTKRCNIVQSFHSSVLIRETLLCNHLCGKFMPGLTRLERGRATGQLQVGVCQNVVAARYCISQATISQLQSRYQDTDDVFDMQHTRLTWAEWFTCGCLAVLGRFLVTEWDMVRNMRCRCEACISAAGGLTRYRCNENNKIISDSNMSVYP